MKIYLLGYMGCGKTSLASELSKQLKCACLDTDDMIESEEGIPITTIFKERGETYFRAMEKKILLNICERDNVVVATGGGLPCDEDQIELINATGKSFYICLNSKILTERLYEEKSTRPLIASFDNKLTLCEFIKSQLSTREKYYFQANFIIDGNQSLQQIVSDIKGFL